MPNKRLICLMGIPALFAAAAIAATSGVMSVQVRKAEIRDTPSFLGRVVTAVAYGDKVTVQSQDGAWMKVTGGGQSGWIHSSALTRKNIVMKAGPEAQTAASSGEMALAGKGFNSDVEAQFKAGHKDIDFSPVDKMEKIKIPAPTLKEFAEEGGLGGKGGAK